MPQSTGKSGNPRRSRAALLTTASIVSFSLTLLAGSLAVLVGIVPLHAINTGLRFDIGAFLFLMPVVALILGVIVEAGRIALRSEELPDPRPDQQINWARTKG
jgi:hypothetical protein